MKSVTPDTEILTINGWCLSDKLTKQDKIAQINYKLDKNISFLSPININNSIEEYLYLFSSINNAFSQIITRNTIVHIKTNEFSPIYFDYAKNINYTNNSFIYCSGYKLDGKNKLDILDKILTLISISNGIIKETKEEFVFGFTSLALGNDIKIINLAKELDLKPKWNKRGNYCLELTVNKNLINQLDIFNLNWIELDKVNHDWIINFITMLHELTTAPRLKKLDLLQYRSNNKKEIEKLQGLCAIAGINSKLISILTKKNKYLLEMIDNPLKKCQDINRDIFPYYDEVININTLDNGIIIKHGDNVSIL